MVVFSATAMPGMFLIISEASSQSLEPEPVSCFLRNCLHSFRNAVPMLDVSERQAAMVGYLEVKLQGIRSGQFPKRCTSS